MACSALAGLKLYKGKGTSNSSPEILYELVKEYLAGLSHIQNTC